MARQWTGYGTPRDKPGAFLTWTTLASFREDARPSLRARACSSLAKVWLDRAHKKGLSNATLNIGHLYDTGNNANEAVALGLTSHTTLQVAKRIESAGLRRPEDGKFPEGTTERFERLTNLWEALDMRDAEAAGEMLKREGKLFKDPMGYSCAAEDCGIMGTKKYTLRSCSGGCPRALRPHYCSKECQKVVRFFSRTSNNGAHLPCRTGNTINRFADRMLRYRALFQLIVRAWGLSSNDRFPWRVQSPKAFSRVRSGTSASTSAEEGFCSSLPVRSHRRRLGG